MARQTQTLLKQYSTSCSRYLDELVQRHCYNVQESYQTLRRAGWQNREICAAIDVFWNKLLSSESENPDLIAGELDNGQRFKATSTGECPVAKWELDAKSWRAKIDHLGSLGEYVKEINSLCSILWMSASESKKYEIAKDISMRGDATIYRLMGAIPELQEYLDIDRIRQIRPTRELSPRVVASALITIIREHRTGNPDLQKKLLM